MRLSEIFALFAQPMNGEDKTVRHVSLDTRTIESNDVFVAFKGESFDGHDCLGEAKEKGAIAAVVERKMDVDLPQCVVPDVGQAYAKLGKLHRQQMPAKILSMTGSMGKTTVKNMLASIFSQVGPTNATEKNYNNEIGVPMTLLKLKPEHQWGVIEIGANSPGEIERNGRVAQPDCALITIIAEQHVEGMGYKDSIAREKIEIYTHLQPNGTAILPKDDEFFPLFEARTRDFKQLTFGFDPSADITAKDVHVDETGRTVANVITPKGEFELKTKLLGKHNVYNALAATAVAISQDVSLDVIKSGLESVNPEDKRLTVYPGYNKSRLIDDCYNASPMGIAAALEVLSQHTGEKVWVFADMGELGDKCEYYHKWVGEQAKALGVNEIYAVGTHAQLTLSSFGEGGKHFDSKEALVAALKPKLHEQMTVLVKGSRGNKLETVVEALKS